MGVSSACEGGGEVECHPHTCFGDQFWRHISPRGPTRMHKSTRTLWREFHIPSKQPTTSGKPPDQVGVPLPWRTTVQTPFNMEAISGRELPIAPSQITAKKVQLQVDITTSDESEGSMSNLDQQYLPPDGSVYSLNQDCMGSSGIGHYSPDSATFKPPATHTSHSWSSNGDMYHHTPNQSPIAGSSSQTMALKLSTESKPLKRYSACHTCRRRKLKCDGRRPACTPCFRHREADRSLATGENISSYCTYDDAEDARQKERMKRSMSTAAHIHSRGREAIALPPVAVPVKKAKAQSMKAKIAMLERQLSETRSKVSDESPSLEQAMFSVSHMPVKGDSDEPPRLAKSLSYHGSDSRPSSSRSPLEVSFASAIKLESEDQLEYDMIPIQGGLDTSLAHQTLHLAPHFKGYQHPPDVLQSGWPTVLPPRQLVIDMIQIYLRGGDAMSKIIDAQDLLARLASSPILPVFPHLGLIHVLLALASSYMMISLPTNDFNMTTNVDTAALQVVYDVRGSEFRERHASLAEATVLHTMNGWIPPLDMVHASLFLAQYVASRHRTIKAALLPSVVSRLCFAMGINEVATMQEQQKPLVCQKGTLDMTMWMSYTVDCQAAATTGKPPCIQEIELALPIPIIVSSPAGEICYGPGLQTLESRDLFNHHPSCDSTIFYIKSMILMGRVIVFARKVRSKPGHTTPESLLQELEYHHSQIEIFLLCINEYLRNADFGRISNDMVVCLVATHLSTIFLNDTLHLFRRLGVDTSPPGKTAIAGMVSLANELLSCQPEKRWFPPFAALAFFHCGRAIRQDLNESFQSGDQARYCEAQSQLGVILVVMGHIGSIHDSAAELAKGLHDQGGERINAALYSTKGYTWEPASENVDLHGYPVTATTLLSTQNWMPATEMSNFSGAPVAAFNYPPQDWWQTTQTAYHSLGIVNSGATHVVAPSGMLGYDPHSSGTSLGSPSTKSTSQGGLLADGSRSLLLECTDNAAAALQIQNAYTNADWTH